MGPGTIQPTAFRRKSRVCGRRPEGRSAAGAGRPVPRPAPCPPKPSFGAVPGGAAVAWAAGPMIRAWSELDPQPATLERQHPLPASFSRAAGSPHAAHRGHRGREALRPGERPRRGPQGGVAGDRARGVCRPRRPVGVGEVDAHEHTRLSRPPQFRELPARRPGGGDALEGRARRGPQSPPRLRIPKLQPPGADVGAGECRTADDLCPGDPRPRAAQTCP